ncbi:hypothetical protein M2263_000150 [Providencia alcalifaciens]|nr:hypothetical protein [Providencia alcalifaciens]
MASDKYKSLPVAIAAARRKSRESLSGVRFCVVQLPMGILSVLVTNDARRRNKSIAYSVGCDRYHTVLPEVI